MSCDVSDLNGLFHVKCNGFEHITPLGGHRIYKLNLPAGTKSVELKFIAENSYTLDNVELTIEDYDTEVDLIQNGDFSQHGKHWKGERVNYYNGTALVATGGYIGQEVQLSSPLKAGSAVKVSFTLSNLYGSQVRVLVNGVDHPYISDAGEHVLEFILEKDTDTLRLQFTTNNTFTLDDVKMVVSL